MERTTHHFANIPTDSYGNISVEFGVLWTTHHNNWYLSDIFVEMAEPDVLSIERLRHLVLDFVEVNGYNPTTPYEGEYDEETNDAD